MLKALFRKQFAELISQFNKKKSGNGKPSSKRALVTFLAIFGVLYLSIGVSFFAVFKEILGSLSTATYPLYYMLAGSLATAVGLLGSVFNAYATIFDAKDNEMLLSLPIPPHRIVFVRVAALSAMTLLYSGTVLLPAAIVFLMYAETTLLGYINALLAFLPLVLLVEAVTLGIAFVVAAISRKVKNKKVVVVVLSLLLTLVFYFVYFRAQSLLTEIVAITEIPKVAQYALFFYYALGRAAQGHALSMLIALGTGAGAFLIAYFLLSKNFVKFTTAKKSPSAKGKKGVIKAGSSRLALFKREWNIFSSSPSYVMNSGFGVIFLIGVPIFAIIKAGMIRGWITALAEFFPNANGCAIAAILVLLTEGMCCITTPSISMEGKRLYILRSLPIDTTEVFRAKISLHLAVVLPFALFSTITFAAVLGADALSWIFMILVVLAHTLFTACLGLCANVNAPVLDWTDEMVAVKSGISVLLSVFGTMILTIVIGGLYFFCTFFLPDSVYLLIVTLLYALADFIMIRWLGTRGKAKFEKLG